MAIEEVIVITIDVTIDIIIEVTLGASITCVTYVTLAAGLSKLLGAHGDADRQGVGQQLMGVLDVPEVPWRAAGDVTRLCSAPSKGR